MQTEYVGLSRLSIFNYTIFDDLNYIRLFLLDKGCVKHPELNQFSDG